MEFENIYLPFIILMQIVAVFGSESCGSNVKGTGLIIGGSFSEKNQWPWLVALVNKSDENFFCGGTLISKRHVLTAAHCIQPKGQTIQIRFDEFVVLLGKHNLTDRLEHGSFKADPLKVLVHRDWNYLNDRFDADIAIVFLEYEVQLSGKIAPICVSDTLSLQKKGTVVDKYETLACTEIIWNFSGRLGN